MTGLCRWQWKHGIFSVGKAFAEAGGGAEPAAPHWNPRNARKSWTLRATKGFNMLQLERALARATGAGDKARADALRARVAAQKKHWPERHADSKEFTPAEQAEAQARAEYHLSLMDAAPATRARMPREWAGWPGAAKDALYRSGGGGGGGGGAFSGGGGGAFSGGYGPPAGYGGSEEGSWLAILAGAEPGGGGGGGGGGGAAVLAALAALLGGGGGGGGSAAAGAAAAAAQRRRREDDEAEDLAAALRASAEEEAARRAAAAKKPRLEGAPLGGPATGGEEGDVVEVLEEDAGSEAEEGSVVELD